MKGREQKGWGRSTKAHILKKKKKGKTKIFYIYVALPTEFDKQLNVKKKNKFAFFFLLPNAMHHFTIAIKDYCYPNTEPHAVCAHHLFSTLAEHLRLLAVLHWCCLCPVLIFWSVLIPKRGSCSLKTVFHESTSLITSSCTYLSADGLIAHAQTHSTSGLIKLLLILLEWNLDSILEYTYFIINISIRKFFSDLCPPSLLPLYSLFLFFLLFFYFFFIIPEKGKQATSIH